jgi:dethiobiotin synthetase/adenosylmethionine--8-amino-7-oxononanoate aminotransferase
VTPELEKAVPTPPQFESLSELFDASRFDASGPLYKAYESQITSELIQLRDEGRKFGALILEPVLLGAGGMILM